MAKDDPHFRLRIPAELKTAIERAAKESNRSINAEIVLRLNESFRSTSAGGGSMTIVLEALPPGTPTLKVSVGDFMRRFAEASADFVALGPDGETVAGEVKSHSHESGGGKLSSNLNPSPNDKEMADKAASEARTKIYESRKRAVQKLAARKTPDSDKPDE